MDQQVQKLANFLIKYLGKTINYVEEQLGKPKTFTGSNIWFYRFRRKIVFQDEIVFFIENKKVIDIAMTEYLFGIPTRNIFYQSKEGARFEMANLLSKKKYSITII